MAPGFFSEEGSEHNNIIIRQNREHHSRQFSLKVNLEDCFMRSVHSSDPEILEIIEKELLSKRKKWPISDTLKMFCDFPENIEVSDSDSESSSSEESDHNEE